MQKVLWAAALILAVAGNSAVAAAQDYPAKPIRLIVPFPPGGGSDLSGRVAADYLSEKLGQPVVVENKPGGGTAIGLDLVAKSRPDGYTLAWGTSDGISMLPALKRSMPYKIPDDFVFVATGAKTAPVVAVNAKLPIKSLDELIAYAKSHPGKLRYGTPGVGGGPHLATALLAKAAGISLVHIPYQGTAPAVVAAVGGHVDLVMAGRAAIKPHVDSGALRALATADTERLPQFPDMPTLEEAGLGISVILYFGVLAPAGTPDPIVERLRAALGEMFRDKKTAERFRGVGYEPAFLNGTEYRDFMVKDLQQWKEVVKAANIPALD
jgi:tripartite-type tricarboxylate transporter receptor subunit TctC